MSEINWFGKDETIFTKNIKQFTDLEEEQEEETEEEEE